MILLIISIVLDLRSPGLTRDIDRLKRVVFWMLVEFIFSNAFAMYKWLSDVYSLNTL